MKKIKIAFIDDSAQMVKMYEDYFLRDAAFEVVGSAADGMKGLQLIEKAQPDAVLLDIVMPELDGFGVLDRLNAAKSRLKIIMVSAL